MGRWLMALIAFIAGVMFSDKVKNIVSSAKPSAKSDGISMKGGK